MSGRRVIFSNYGLAGRYGTEFFLSDVTTRLQQRGTQCGIFSPRLGPFTGEFRAAGIAVWDDPDKIDWEPDVLHCHHVAEAVRLLNRFPGTPAIFMVHEPRLWQGLAPVTPQIRRYIAVDQLCRERLARDCGFREDSIQIIPNGVDLERFQPRSPLPVKPQRAIIFTSSAANNEHLILARKVCQTLGIHLDEGGHAAGNVLEHPEKILPQYDLVFAKARCALEALSVGCAVILIGAEGVGEMVSTSRFDHFRAMNFGMGLLQLPLTEEALVSQIERYDPNDAALVTRRIRETCGVEHTVAALEALYAEVAATKDAEPIIRPMVNLGTASHISGQLSSETIWLTQNMNMLSEANHELELVLKRERERVEELVQVGHEQQHSLKQEQMRLEHCRSEVKELRDRIAKKRSSPTVSTSRKEDSQLLSFLKPFKETWRRLCQTKPGVHEGLPPMPIIVGSPRSGTTLLRLMLDTHPQLAIPPETGFIVPLTSEGKECYDGVENFWKLLTGYPDSRLSAWPDFHLNEQALRDALEKIHPFDSAEGLRAFYRLYASRFQKSRFGDKTPVYARHMTGIEALLPEARFIHIVRDGRDTAVSLRDLWFSPGDTMTAQAAFWRDNVMVAREQGRQVRHYLEVSYERLVRDPKTVLHDICDFIELPYSKEMLNYHQHASQRINEHEERLNDDGTVMLSKDARFKQQASSSKALMPELIDRWRSELTVAEVGEFETVAGETLRLFGYETITGH